MIDNASPPAPVFSFPVRVYFEDTDFSGVVYHANYLKFMERGRSEFLRARGIHHAALAARRLAFAVIHMDIDFRKPARIDDDLIVETAPASITGARLVLDQSVKRGTELLARATVTIVMIDFDGRPQRLPADVRAAVGGEA